MLGEQRLSQYSRMIDHPSGTAGGLAQIKYRLTSCYEAAAFKESSKNTEGNRTRGGGWNRSNDRWCVASIIRVGKRVVEARRRVEGKVSPRKDKGFYSRRGRWTISYICEIS